MNIFIDTSAFYAMLDRDDMYHEDAKKAWKEILMPENVLVTSNYVIIECFALIQNRLGFEAVRGFQEDIVPLLNIEWVTTDTHRAGISALLAAAKKKLSLVDCVSFEIIRALGIKDVFAFDTHFVEQGFRVIPT